MALCALVPSMLKNYKEQAVTKIQEKLTDLDPKTALHYLEQNEYFPMPEKDKLLMCGGLSKKIDHIQIHEGMISFRGEASSYLWQTGDYCDMK